MKKINFVLLAIIAVFIGVIKVNAATYYIKDNCQNMDNGMGKVCYPTLVVEGGNVSFNKIELNFQMIGITFDSKNVSLNQGFRVQSATDTSLTIITSKTIFSPGSYDIGTISFYKITSASVCNIVYSYKFYNEDRKCQIINNIYYDKDGNETDKLTYQKQCEPNICKVLTDGTNNYYYGTDGTEVSKEVYEDQCLPKKYCIQDGDNYYGKNGTNVSKEEYEEQCLEKKYCVVEGGKYYGKEGTEVSKEEYEEQCLEKKYCVIEDGKYYDKTGNETTKEMYDYLCNRHYCEIIQINDTTEYYGKNGNKTDKSTYESECLESKKCIKENDKYYGENGEEIDKITFEKICQKNVCIKLDDGTYYGKEGTVVDEITYDLECNINTCKVVGDKYFDDKGNMVSKEEYKKACDNPQTGKNVPYTPVVIGIISAGILLFIGKRYTKLRKI